MCSEFELERKIRKRGPRSNPIVVPKQIHATIKLNKCSFLFLFNFDLNDLSSVFVVRSYERESEVITGFPVQHTRQCLYSLTAGPTGFCLCPQSLWTGRLPVLVRSPTRPLRGYPPGPLFPGFGTRPFCTEARRRLGPQGFHSRATDLFRVT